MLSSRNRPTCGRHFPISMGNLKRTLSFRRVAFQTLEISNPVETPDEGSQEFPQFLTPRCLSLDRSNFPRERQSMQMDQASTAAKPNNCRLSPHKPNRSSRQPITRRFLAYRASRRHPLALAKPKAPTKAGVRALWCLANNEPDSIRMSTKPPPFDTDRPRLSPEISVVYV